MCSTPMSRRCHRPASTRRSSGPIRPPQRPKVAKAARASSPARIKSPICAGAHAQFPQDSGDIDAAVGADRLGRQWRQRARGGVAVARTIAKGKPRRRAKAPARCDSISTATPPLRPRNAVLPATGENGGVDARDRALARRDARPEKPLEQNLAQRGMRAGNARHRSSPCSNRHVAGTQRGIQPAGEPKAHDGRKFDLGQIKERRVQQATSAPLQRGITPAPPPRQAASRESPVTTRIGAEAWRDACFSHSGAVVIRRFSNDRRSDDPARKSPAARLRAAFDQAVSYPQEFKKFLPLAG